MVNKDEKSPLEWLRGSALGSELRKVMFYEVLEIMLLELDKLIGFASNLVALIMARNLEQAQK